MFVRDPEEVLVRDPEEVDIRDRLAAAELERDRREAAEAVPRTFDERPSVGDSVAACSNSVETTPSSLMPLRTSK